MAENPLRISEIEHDLSEIEKPKNGNKILRSDPELKSHQDTKLKSSSSLSTKQKKKISMVQPSNNSHNHLYYYNAHHFVLVGAQKQGYHWDTFFKNSYRLRIEWVIDAVKRF